MKKLKYWLVTIEKTIGEFTCTLKKAFAAADDEDIEKYAIKWLSDYFGDVTHSYDSHIFYNIDDSCAVKFSGAKEITKAEFDVLNKYL